MVEQSKIRKVKATELQAWPVVSSILFEIATSDDIVSVIGRAGLAVDWSLTEQEDFSHKTRKRAYMPRVQRAYSTLPSEDRDTALSLIIAELARRYPQQSENIRAAVAEVGWTLKVVARSDSQTEKAITEMKRDKELQKLLLLQVRNGGEPAGLENYSEDQQVYNAALLINDGYVDGQAIKDATDTYRSAVMTELTSKGHDLLDSIENSPKPDRREERKSDPSFSKNAKTSKRIFVSHSSEDEDLAEALVEMLCAALHLRRSEFVCTSVEGAKLRGGDDTDNFLRREISETPAFLSLLTPKAVTSTYVLFELGARWGSGEHHIPLLAKGAGTDVLKEPLKAKNALRLSEEANVLQLVEDLAVLLGCTAEPPNSYLKKVRDVAQISSAGEIVEIERLARMRLRECVDILKNAGSLESGLGEIRGLQRSLKQKREEVVVIVDDRIALHANSGAVNQDANIHGWPDQKSNGRPCYPSMKSQRRGIRIAQIVNQGARQTALAFETVDNPGCMIVAEAHYHP
jgi:hypothetical protein